MSGIGDVVIRQVVRTLTKKGVRKAMKSGKRGKKGGDKKKRSEG